MQMVTVTDEDIEYAAKVLNIPNGFDAPRVNVIKCMESRDVVACPGSGKTTVLLAKLLILARHIPLKNNKGICILTHTNVAIDEIKERLGDKANELLTYPNFVGTIHSFISKFLANPAFVNYYSGRISRVFEPLDYKLRLIKKYKSLYPPFSGSKLDGFLYGRLNKKIKESKDNSKIAKAKDDLLRSLELDYTDNTIKKVAFNKKTTVLKNPNSDAYKEYITLIDQLQNEGICSYNELQGLAHRYVNDFPRELQSIFSERFSFVFVDEMQDTSLLQLQVLEKIFDNEKMIFQCFGDPQQTIYESDDKGCSWEPKDPLFIKNSNRLSKSIAKVADVVALKPYGMLGRESQKGTLLSPVIISYKDNDVSHVLESFAKLIIKYKLDELDNAIFKAVGMVKDKNEGLSITSYFPVFEKLEIRSNVNKDFSDLKSYLVMLDKAVIEKEGIKAYYYRFILAILKYLRINDIRTDEGRLFSKISFLKYLRENDERLYKTTHRYFARIVLAIAKGKCILASFNYILAIIVNRLFCFKVNIYKDEFMNGTPVVATIAVNEEKVNMYRYDDLRIELDSVHGVKGQTHNATLYLETFYFSKTNESIIKFLIGEQSSTIEEHVEKHIRVAYVAMTRPTDLLCIVLNEEIYLENKVKLNDLGWIHYQEII
ncbi:UvrD-helicase domain-containing protein [Paenibacillus polymyxa]|uniref:UvrD-helicase domain-containing protein n=1 Tax=Paenibacillus polymyxa TaxID=1406 RepID=UPI0025B72CA2|nr:UvrD-helicase domain-containing protein [Paenibacillus polymyxa]MDN4077809.1 UvrD-helicase domain-containing protein [Paenibacillus polymyxa]MDN4103233.1 UvrD-helicase domain-containing protein [Paenibacillus polymyxa]MDN4114134.1 UvrD-helicase domain-containing protein [Paenibacillus polymyxa]